VGSGRWRRADDDTVHLRAQGTTGRGRTPAVSIEVGPPSVELEAECAEGRGVTSDVGLTQIVPLGVVASISAKSRTGAAKVRTDDTIEVLRIIEMLTKRAA
jgi:hypothetical protein